MRPTCQGVDDIEGKEDSGQELAGAAGGPLLRCLPAGRQAGAPWPW